MIQQPLQLAFIGGGLNSAVGNTHRIACEMDHRWILAAGCFSTRESMNRETAMRWGIDMSRVYPDWTALLQAEAGRVDAVCLLTPTPLHAEMAVAALNQGFAVICEKSMATSVEEAHAICSAVQSNSAFFTVTYNYSGYPMLRELREMIAHGRLGKLQVIQIEMPQEGFARLNKAGERPRPQRWRLSDGVIPTLSLDLGVHVHQLVHFLTGERPIEVVADHSSYGFFDGIKDNVMCLARYTGNLRSQIWYSKMALGHRNGLRVRLYGDQGSAEWFQLQPEDLLFYDIQGRREIIDRASVIGLADAARYNRFKSGHPAGFIEAFANLYYDIADALTEFRQTGSQTSPWVFSAELAREGLQMLEAIAQSAESNTWRAVVPYDQEIKC